MDVLERVESEAVVADLVWIPKLESDSFEAAEELYPTSPDPRVRLWWDGDGVLMETVAEHMCAEVAWDVYLMYDPGRVWEGDSPGAPDAFFHKLSECPAELYMSRYPFLVELESRLPECTKVE